MPEAPAITTTPPAPPAIPPRGGGFGQSVTTAHEWTTKDIRNIPEYDVTVTTDTPARGYYINGETPVITIVLKDTGDRRRHRPHDRG